MHIDLTDQVALVTGSAHRVGKAIALELARCGVHILVHYNSSPDAATQTVREIKSLGVTCALCHSTVDDSVAPGIGERLDGWPNLDLNVGAIIALSPAVTAEQRDVFLSWGPGRIAGNGNTAITGRPGAARLAAPAGRVAGASPRGRAPPFGGRCRSRRRTTGTGNGGADSSTGRRAGEDDGAAFGAGPRPDPENRERRYGAPHPLSTADRPFPALLLDAAWAKH